MMESLKFDLCRILRGAKSVLIVGSGYSAADYKDLGLRHQYEFVLTINNASQVAKDADFHLVEPANNANFAHMISGVDLAKVMLKQKGLLRLTEMKRKEIDDIYEASGLPIQVLHYSLPSAKLWGLIRMVHVRLSRTSVQWCGSLSLLIDCCVKAKVPQIGFIGTDFGGQYAVEPDWQVRSVVTHPLATKRRRGYSFFYILKLLKLTGYLRGITFFHFHKCEDFKKLL